ncbi:ABC transporter ATP-binding protein [Candidatus Saccharibacteria bacterium]|nr:ABC transporter ATP-binding protein [Candidatus Saccharibacteria bacterium]MBR1796224.1 ABC transporter ATP-binding protein [Candidatus Saccharibacteria bacterium]
MGIIIEAKGLTKTYGKRAAAFTALRDVNFQIEEGETLAIVGKSGSGKSTLMHLLALLDTPTHGTIKIDGIAASRLKGRKLNKLRNQRFGFVFQQFFMNANDTVLENVMLPLKIGKVNRFKRKKLAMEALKTVGLEDKAKNKATDLSGGQKQRVCIARAIVNNPKVIFADEPTGNLDSGTGDKITDLLFDLAKKQGVTLIIVTHDEDLAKLCNRIIRISDGQIISDQTVRSDYQAKASEKREKEAARVRKANK